MSQSIFVMIALLAATSLANASDVTCTVEGGVQSFDRPYQSSYSRTETLSNGAPLMLSPGYLGLADRKADLSFFDRKDIQGIDHRYLLAVDFVSLNAGDWQHGFDTEQVSVEVPSDTGTHMEVRLTYPLSSSERYKLSVNCSQ